MLIVTLAPCAVEWPICPVCAEPLASSAGTSTCPVCGRSWPDAERAPCPDPIAGTFQDAGGRRGECCLAHLALGLEVVIGSTLVERDKPPEGLEALRTFSRIHRAGRAMAGA